MQGNRSGFCRSDLHITKSVWGRPHCFREQWVPPSRDVWEGWWTLTREAQERSLFIKLTLEKMEAFRFVSGFSCKDLIKDSDSSRDRPHCLRGLNSLPFKVDGWAAAPGSGDLQHSVLTRTMQAIYQSPSAPVTKSRAGWCVRFFQCLNSFLRGKKRTQFVHVSHDLTCLYQGLGGFLRGLPSSLAIFRSQPFRVNRCPQPSPKRHRWPLQGG